MLAELLPYQKKDIRWFCGAITTCFRRIGLVSLVRQLSYEKETSNHHCLVVAVGPAKAKGDNPYRKFGVQWIDIPPSIYGTFWPTVYCGGREFFPTARQQASQHRSLLQPSDAVGCLCADRLG